LKPRKRITKKQIKEDKFVTNTFKVVEFVQEHMTQLILGVVAIVVIVAISILVTNSRKGKELEAAAQLGRAQLVYQTGDYEGAVHLLEPVLRQYGGSISASQATYYLANCHYFSDNYDKALEFYKKYLNMKHTLPSLKASAMAGVAACHEQKGEFSDAARQYEEAVKVFPEYYQAPEFLMSAGRCFESAGQTEEAKKAYQKVVDAYPESNSIQMAKIAVSEF